MAKVVNRINISGGASTPTVVANYSALPDPATVSGKFYWCSASQGTSWLPGKLGGTYYSAGQYYSNGTDWEFIEVPYQATQVEVDDGSNTDKFVTPDTLKNSSQWATKENSLGYTAENSANKTSTITGNETSTTLYSTIKGIVDYFTASQIRSILGISTLSGSNTGDNATNSQYSGLDSRISQSVSIPLNSTSLTPADATTYYISSVITTASTTESSRRFKFPYATTIRTVNFNIQQVGNGSNETVSVYLRNSTGSTETLVGTFTSDFGAASITSFNFSGLTIAIPNTTDFWTLKIVCPTWTTNPTGWIINTNVIAN